MRIYGVMLSTPLHRKNASKANTNDGIELSQKSCLLHVLFNYQLRLDWSV